MLPPTAPPPPPTPCVPPMPCLEAGGNTTLFFTVQTDMTVLCAPAPNSNASHTIYKGSLCGPKSGKAIQWESMHTVDPRAPPPLSPPLSLCVCACSAGALYCRCWHAAVGVLVGGTGRLSVYGNVRRLCGARSTADARVLTRGTEGVLQGAARVNLQRSTSSSGRAQTVLPLKPTYNEVWTAFAKGPRAAMTFVSPTSTLHTSGSS